MDIEAKELMRKRAIYNKEVRLLSREKTAYKTFQELNCSDKDYKPKLITPSSKSVATKERIDIIISDLHYSGSRDDQKIKNLFAKQIANLKEIIKAKPNSKVRLAFLGDDIEGELHLSSLDKHQEENTINQVIGVRRHYANFIESVCKVVGYKNVEVAFVPESNHGQIRLHGMSRGQAPRNDVGYDIREFLIYRFIDKGVKF